MFECATCGLEYYGDEMCAACGDCLSCCSCGIELYRGGPMPGTFDRDELGADPEED